MRDQAQAAWIVHHLETMLEVAKSLALRNERR